MAELIGKQAERCHAGWGDGDEDVREEPDGRWRERTDGTGKQVHVDRLCFEATLG